VKILSGLTEDVLSVVSNRTKSAGQSVCYRLRVLSTICYISPAT